MIPTRHSVCCCHLLETQSYIHTQAQAQAQAQAQTQTQTPSKKPKKLFPYHNFRLQPPPGCPLLTHRPLSSPRPLLSSSSGSLPHVSLIGLSSSTAVPPTYSLFLLSSCPPPRRLASPRLNFPSYPESPIPSSHHPRALDLPGHDGREIGLVFTSLDDPLKQRVPTVPEKPSCYLARAKGSAG